MIKLTCVRVGTLERFNRKLKGSFVRTFSDMYELSDWTNKAWRSVCFPRIKDELTKEQLKWLSKRRMLYRQYR